jgi:hypothetical protein
VGTMGSIPGGAVMPADLTTSRPAQESTIHD